MVDQLGVGPGGLILAERREVAGYLAVEKRGLAQFGARKAAHAAAGGLVQKPVEAVPVRAAFGDPPIGENCSHGTDWRPA